MVVEGEGAFHIFFLGAPRCSVTPLGVVTAIGMHTDFSPLLHNRGDLQNHYLKI